MDVLVRYTEGERNFSRASDGRARENRGRDNERFTVTKIKGLEFDQGGDIIETNCWWKWKFETRLAIYSRGIFTSELA